MAPLSYKFKTTPDIKYFKDDVNYRQWPKRIQIPRKCPTTEFPKLSQFCLLELARSMNRQDIMQLWRVAEAMKIQVLKEEVHDFIHEERNSERIRAVVKEMAKSNPKQVRDLVADVRVEMVDYFDDVSGTETKHQGEKSWGDVYTQKLFDGQLYIKGVFDVAVREQDEDLKRSVCQLILQKWNSLEVVDAMEDIIKASPEYLVDIWDWTMRKLDKEGRLWDHCHPYRNMRRQPKRAKYESDDVPSWKAKDLFEK